MAHEAARGGHRPTEILMVNPAEQDREHVRLLFPNPDWRVHFVQSVCEAGQLLNQRPIDVILCDRDLPDGTWVDILGAAASAHFRPRVVVTSHRADERMWAEVLSLGGHDLLVTPFDPGEVGRVVEMALRRRAPRGGVLIAEAPHAMTAP
jgi:DNA-binding response OmpR family regulator